MALFSTEFMATRSIMIIPHPGFIVLSSGSISNRLDRCRRSPIRNRGITNIN